MTTLADILIGVLSNLVSDEVRVLFEQWGYRRALKKRIKGLQERVAHTHGDDGVALLQQAAECVSKAQFTQEAIIEAALPVALFAQLAEKYCYKARIRTLLPAEREQFEDFSKRILGFICRELPRIDEAHREIAAETLRRTARIESKIDALGSDVGAVRAGVSRQSEAEQQRNEMEAKQFLVHIEKCLLEYEYDLAYATAQQLREWLGRRGEDQPSSLMASIYLVLAEVETIRAKEISDQGERADLSGARSFLAKAQPLAFGALEDRISALNAYIISFEQGADSGLALLAGRRDPHAVRRKLQILRQAKRTDGAAAFARGLTPDQTWCEQAAFVLAIENQRRASDRLLEWCRSQSNTTIRDRCLLGHAHGLYERLTQRYQPSTIVPIDIAQEDIAVLEEIVNTVSPIVQTASARGHVVTRLEAWAGEVALLSQVQLQDISEHASLAGLLATHKPILLALARLALAQRIDLPADCVERLRNEHKDSFEAKLLACAIEWELLHRPEDAFNSAMDLVGQAKQPEHRERLCGLLGEVAQHLGDEARAEVSRIAPSLLSNGDRFLEFLEVDSLLREGCLEQASKALESLEDQADPVWLQVSASFLAQSGDTGMALDRLIKATDIMPHPDLLWRTAALAYHSGRLDDAAALLRTYIALRPRDIPARANLATVCMDTGDYRAAAQEFAALQELDPANLSHAFNRSVSLVACGETGEATTVLDSALGESDVPLQFLLQRAAIAKALGQPGEALALLKGFRDKYWEQHEFLIEFMTLGYAAGDELAAHQAFAQLQHLQAEGKAPEILQQFSLDDLVERIRKHNEQADHVHEEMLRGRASWLMAEEFLGRVPYMGWWIRTQPAEWLVEDPVYRARYTVYSTNGFTVAKDERRLLSLQHIECPPRDTTVVADISSLITLHRLGLLTTAAEFFGKILVPSAYQLSALRDSSALITHQMSVKTALQEVKTLIDKGRISIQPELDVPDQRKPVPHLDEYAGEDEKGDIYRLQDVLNALHSAGEIRDDRYSELQKVAHKSGRTDSSLPRIFAGQEIVIDLSTLRTLSQAGALEIVTDFLSIHITAQQNTELVASLDAITKQEKVREWHLDMWSAIRADSRFVSISHFVPPELQQDRDRHTPELDVDIAAPLVAEQVGVPLLVDDRMIQMIGLNRSRGSTQAAFGTDHLLKILNRSELMSISDFTESLLQLMRWRYRFVIPTPEMLKHLSDQFTHVPAKPMQEVALYAQDCMRDPGLFSGLEATQPPQMMAFHLYQEWVTTVTEFVLLVWNDDAYDNDRASRITEWAMTELLPALPRTLAPWFRARIGTLERNSILTLTILKSVTLKDARRAHEAIGTITRSIGVDPDGEEYLGLAAGAIDGI